MYVSAEVYVVSHSTSTGPPSMQHLGVNRKPRSRLPTSSSALPGGWFSIEPQLPKNDKPHARSGPDALGLAKTVDPLTFLVRKPSNRSPDESGVNNGKQQQNPRRRRLRAAGENVFPAAEVFSPQRSLRLAKLPMLTTKERHIEPENGGQSNQLAAMTPVYMASSRETELPLHELIQTVDDAVKADPMAELNQAAVARLFMDQWLRQFEADRRNFKSVGEEGRLGWIVLCLVRFSQSLTLLLCSGLVRGRF